MRPLSLKLRADHVAAIEARTAPACRPWTEAIRTAIDFALGLAPSPAVNAQRRFNRRLTHSDPDAVAATARLSHAQFEAIELEAHRRGTSKNAVVRWALARWIASTEAPVVDVTTDQEIEG